VLRSFGFAFRGLSDAWRCERNFRIQCAYALATAGLLVWLRPEATSALLVLLAMTLLLAAELMNSAVERAVDLSVQGFHPLARLAKDLAASSVLLTAVATAVINLWVIGSLIAPSSQLAFSAFVLAVAGLRFGRGGIR
jgi:diacylglycerol kinase